VDESATQCICTARRANTCQDVANDDYSWIWAPKLALTFEPIEARLRIPWRREYGCKTTGINAIIGESETTYAMIELVNHGRCAVSAIHDQNPTTDRLSSPGTQGDATVTINDIAWPTLLNEHVNRTFRITVSIVNSALVDLLFRYGEKNRPGPRAIANDESNQLDTAPNLDCYRKKQ
jgi:hypothetical protein